MTGHAFIPTQQVARPKPTVDPEALQRAVSHVGSDFPAVGVWLVEGWASA